METRELERIDLNLLIALQVLLEEKNVSRAAERLHITQPAMSKTLTRLRDVFADPLFTRSSHGMRPTPRTLELAGNLEQVLQGIQSLLNDQDFDPARYRGEVTLAISEYIGVWLLPPLIRRLAFLAPQLTVKTITRVEHQLQQLALGELDFAVQIKHAHYGDEYLCHPLGGTQPVILAREGHPLSGQTPDWEKVLAYPIMRLYMADQDELEFFQNSASMTRRLERYPQVAGGFETSHLLTAIEILRNTDYLLPAPPFLLNNETLSYRIQALPLPPDIDYSIDYMLVRHQRTENSPLHNWLWQQIIEARSELELDNV
ncbi:MAG: LysR family transcriptional regulator [Pseudomonadota bacterium]